MAMLLASAGVAVAAQPRAPDNLLPGTAGPQPAPSPRATPRPAPAPAIASQPVVQPLPGEAGAQPATVQPLGPQPAPMPVMTWDLADAQALLAFIESAVEAEGLTPADYQPDALRAAIAAGPGAALDLQASRSFDWLVEDLRDGRTPLNARVQWFAVDTDVDATPTASVLAKALASHDIAGTLLALDPDNGEFAALKAALAALPAEVPPVPKGITPLPGTLTPATLKRQREALRVNIERWRWLPRDLGVIYLIANVPEFQVRLVSNHAIIRTYRTVVGKPGRTATPQLAERVQAVVFNPTWTVPQSIVQGEGLGAKLLANPDKGYKVTTSADGTVNVVQLPGPKNSLGMMKIDMPNPHAIYLHDTPSRGLFNAKVRAFSHGCIRTEKAVELGMIMAMLGAGLTPQEAEAKTLAKKYARVTMTKTFPVYITYFTYGRDTSGQLTAFGDIYGRDKPVVTSLNAPRELHTTARVGEQEVIVADDPL
ncbi:MAG: L,D-transpeptidase family protein [Proteobacteria bacterium]|nr:L,D-transpeptidase family protein [Pseudomonadota bacterium]